MEGEQGLETESSTGGSGGVAEGSRPELAKLPRGRHGLPREFIIDNQRRRLLAGLADAVAGKGYPETTVAEITRNAVVSKSSFYDHYETKDDAFIDAYETGMEAMVRRFSAAFETETSWPQAIKAGLAAMLRFLAADPSLAYLLMAEAPLGGPGAVECRDEGMQSIASHLRRGREASQEEKLDELPAITEEALVGGMAALIYRRILAGDAAELEDLLPDLTRFMLTPFVGRAEAAQIAAQG